MTQQDQQSRATLREWISYMVKYPAYFYQATGFRATDANIERFACELFSGDMRLGKVTVPHSKKRNVIRGLGNIAMQLGISADKVLHRVEEDVQRGRWAQWKIPVWKESGVWLAYTKRLSRWARHEKIGNYAYGTKSVSGPRAKARLQGASAQEGLQQYVAQGEGCKAKASPPVRRVREAGKNH